jgi:hypothetical protein
MTKESLDLRHDVVAGIRAVDAAAIPSDRQRAELALGLLEPGADLGPIDVAGAGGGQLLLGHLSADRGDRGAKVSLGSFITAVRMSSIPGKGLVVSRLPIRARATLRLER